MKKGFLARWIINAIALGITANIVRGIETEGILPTVVAALVLGILNAFLRPLIEMVTCLINIITLGLFTFVINAFLLWLTGKMVSGFEVNGFLPALFGAILMAIVSSILTYILSDTGKYEPLGR